MKGGGHKMRVFSLIVQMELNVEKLQELVHTVSSFESETLLSIKGRIVDMKSILGLCTVMLYPGDEVEVRTSGYDEEEAMLAIKRWFCL